MLRKILLPLVLLIFTHQEFYGTEEGENKEEDKNAQVSILKTINNWINLDGSNNNKKTYPKLWFLWAFLDNVPFQYGGSKIWKHGEAYYGLSNGIGFFPSILNFGWLKIGIGDVHINIINTILVGLKFFVAKKSFKEEYSLLENILYTLYYNSVITGIHLLSLNFFNCVKIKIISIGAIILRKILEIITVGDNNLCYWYLACSHNCHSFNNYGLSSSSYLLLSPRIEINISGIINYFNVK